MDNSKTANFLKMSLAQRKLEMSFRQEELNIEPEKNKIQTPEFYFSDFLTFYKETFYHCQTLKKIDYDKYINITDQMIKNKISHNDENTKINTLKEIISNNIDILKQINKDYFSNCI